MRKLSLFIALVALLFADLALAAGGVITSLTGSATVQAGAAPTRVLRQGDEVHQGETIVTGPLSSLVIKFDDGEIAALTSNTKMTVAAYQYNPQNESGNVFLSLVSGGMRAITGLIGRRTPSNVAYRAATATVGIRGTDVIMDVDGESVMVAVSEGVVVVTINGQTLTLTAGMATYASPGQVAVTGPQATVLGQIPQIFQDAVNQLNGSGIGNGGSGGSGGGGTGGNSGASGGIGGSGGGSGGAGGGGSTGTGGSVSPN